MTLESILADPASVRLRRLDRVPVRLLAEALASPVLSHEQRQAYQAEFDATDDWQARMAMCSTLASYTTAVRLGRRAAVTNIGPVAALRADYPAPAETAPAAAASEPIVAATPASVAPGPVPEPVLRLERVEVPMWGDGVQTLGELPADLAWSGEQAPPAVGSQVLVQRGSWRRPKRGTVLAYFHAEGNLGVLVNQPGQAAKPLRNERTNAYFGREVRLAA